MAPLSEMEKYRKRIYDCVIPGVLQHRSLNWLEIEQNWYTDYEPMFLSEALIKAGFPSLLDFLRCYPDELQVEDNSYCGLIASCGPRPPQLLLDNLRLIRQTQAAKKPNPYNREKGILGNPRIQWRYQLAADNAKKAAEKLPPRKPSLSGNTTKPAPAVPESGSNRETPRTMSAYQSNPPRTFNNTVPSVSGSQIYGQSCFTATAGPTLMVPTVVITHGCAPLGYNGAGAIYPPVMSFPVPPARRLPLWYPVNPDENRPPGLLPGPRPKFIPRSVQAHPMSNQQFLTNSGNTDAAMARIAAQSAGFRANSHLPPPDTDEDSEDDVPVPVHHQPRPIPSSPKPSAPETVTNQTTNQNQAPTTSVAPEVSTQSTYSQTPIVGLSSVYLARLRRYRQLREEAKMAAAQ